MGDCPLRFPGQYADEETGLHCNYFRHPMQWRRFVTPMAGLTTWGSKAHQFFAEQK